MIDTQGTALVADTTTEGSPEFDILRDVLRRGWPVAPVAVALAGLGAGADGALSAAFAVGLVALNLAAAAASLAWSARISLGLLMGVALGGYAVRLGGMFAVVFAIKDMGWVHMPSLGITLVVTHLGLLFWELRYVSASLAHPGLKPTSPAPRPTKEPR